MRAVVVARQGSPVAANIEYRTDHPEPGEPGPGQVLLRTLATALNHMDLWVGKGIAGLSLTYPRVSGCDACAEVVGVGPGVDAAWEGRRVVVNAAVAMAPRVHPDDPPGTSLAPEYQLIGEHHEGMLRERFVAPASNLVVVEGCEPVSAAAFGLCTLTAWSMMVTKGGLTPGQSVLITGIGGGVALAALSIAGHLGCRIAVTSRHEWKLKKAAELGAECLVHDTGVDWSRQVREWTRKRGVDMAVDSSGKATHLSCIKSLARGGAYVTPGCTSGADATTDLARVFWNQLRLLGSTMGSADEFAQITALFRGGKLGIPVDGVYAPADAVRAYERLEAAEQFGKVVIEW